jgi:hypothetical protein
VVLHELGYEVLLGGPHLERGAVELVGCRFRETYVERAHILISR